MRRPSIVVLLAVVVCTLAGVDGRLGARRSRTSSTGGHRHRPSTSPFRSLARGGYLPGSATRAPSGARAGRPPTRRPKPDARPPGHLGRASCSTCATGTSRCPPAARQPDTVASPTSTATASPFFQVDPQRDGVVFTANAGGVTTKNSTYPRSELREMNGEEKASWSNRTGTHTLTVRQAVTELPKAKPELVTRTDPRRGERRHGGAAGGQAADRPVRGDKGGKKEFVVDLDYTLGTPYDLRLVATDGAHRRRLQRQAAGSIAQSGSGWYFKTGSYLQSNTEKGDAADAVGKVVLYQVGVTHTG